MASRMTLVVGMTWEEETWEASNQTLLAEPVRRLFAKSRRIATITSVKLNHSVF